MRSAALGRAAPKLAILEAERAQHVPNRGTTCPPEALLPPNPTWEISHLVGLTLGIRQRVRLQYLLQRTHLKHVLSVPSHEPLQTNYCTPNSGKNAIVFRPLRAIASNELLHELVRQKSWTTIAATPLAESTLVPNSQEIEVAGRPGKPRHPELSGIVSCDPDADSNRDANGPRNLKNPKSCETKFSLPVVRNRS